MAPIIHMNKQLAKNSRRNIDSMLSPHAQTMEAGDIHTLNRITSSQGLSPNSMHDFGSNDTQAVTSTELQTPVLTYRQKRRIESAKIGYTGHRRGPSRALGPRRERLKHPGFKPTATISNLFSRIVGPNAANFIAECSNWVKHYCPLNSRSWIKMDATAKQNLFDKIKGEWNLPVGPHVERALTIQCSQLFRQWRYRLKELHFIGKTQQQALKNRPPEVDAIHWRWLVVDYWGNDKTMDISSKNKANRNTQKLRALNGSLSTARIFDSLAHAPITEQPNDKFAEQEGVQSSQVQEEPDYIKLWEKTKRNKDGTWDAYANAKYEQFKKLHADEVVEHGEDNLTVEQAYARVFPEGTGYIIGLGAGPRYSKKAKSFAEELNNLSNERHAEVTQRFEKLNHESQLREASLRKDIHNMKEQAIQRENEAKEREQKLKDDVSTMKDQLAEALKAFKASQTIRS